MAFLVIEIEIPGFQAQDFDDRCGFTGDKQDDINGACNILMAVASGAQNGTVTFTSSALGPLGSLFAPIGFSLLAGNGQVTPLWSNVPGAESYNLYYNTTGSPTLSDTKISGAVSGVPITGLVNGTTYYFIVTAVNTEGAVSIESAASLVASAIPAAPPVSLIDSIMGVSTNYRVIASSTITNTGTSVITGDIALNPGTSVTGFPPGTVSGNTDINNAGAIQGQADLLSAYNNLAARTGPIDLTGQNLGGMTLIAGLYKFDTSAQLTGILTLNAQGNANAQWVFQIGSTLTTATSSSVSLINGAVSDNVGWQVGSSATLGTSTAFVGNVLALTSITAVTSTSVDGRLLARNGAVTLDTNAIS